VVLGFTLIGLGVLFMALLVWGCCVSPAGMTPAEKENHGFGLLVLLLAGVACLLTGAARIDEWLKHSAGGS